MNQHTDSWTLAGVSYHSRLLLGTGKYQDFEQTRDAVQASGAQIVTVAIRRTSLKPTDQSPSLLSYLPPDTYTILPNTAGCYSAKDAIYTAELARELLDGHALIKLEVLGEESQLYPNIRETFVACETLCAQGFSVMVYTNDDPVCAKEFEAMGCAAVMPLASPIGSGLGILSDYNLLRIIERATIPIIVDAGVGTASDVAIAMELGCTAVLLNTAVACARHPVQMATAMKLGVQAGRLAFLAGRMPKRQLAHASSPARE
ncbi:MAG: thiazole synthase [Methylacidiphilales bacterium]|nr:thiazole synthase [Candidatus Methylacidiphilales bacterium]